MKNIFNDQILLGTILLCSMAPTGINAVVTAKIYDLKVDLAVASFLLSTTVYIVIFPLFLFLWLVVENCKSVNNVT